VEWEIQKTEPSVVKSLIDETLARRKATQPVEHPSCGSVFKNPRSSGVSSWQVIDGLKLRGYRIGDAQFSEKHSNFIINCGHAKASDVRSLIEVAKERAQNEMGIELEEEVIYLGA
jgi:UDP-N-acetylmuramate dehydrogenase